MKNRGQIKPNNDDIFAAFSLKMGAENHEKSKRFLILFRKRENVKIAASCRRERQNEGLEGSERQQKTDPKQ